MKIVHFNEYCPKCMYCKNEENEEPCDRCLNVAARPYSHQPIEFKDQNK